MAIVIGGIWHETNTFSPLATGLDATVTRISEERDRAR